LRDHLVPQRVEFAGGRAQAERPRTARRLWIVGVALLGFLLASAPMPVWAASDLSNGSVSPGSGTTATAFSFSVEYHSSPPVQNAQSVWAEAAGVTVPLTLVAGGNTHAGTWEGSSLLPVGSWQVTFHVTISASEQPAPIDGPIVTVTLPPPTPTPSPTPTPRPTAAPTPTPPPGATAAPRAPPPPGNTPDPAVPGPQSTPPGDDDDPTAPSGSSASPRGTGEVLSGTPPPKATPEENDAPAESPDATDPADDAADEDPPGPRIPLLAPLLVVGGAISVAGAGVLGRQWMVTHRTRP
jgi:hypothetical protein